MYKQVFIYIMSFVFAVSSLAAETGSTSTIQINRTAQEPPQRGSSGESINNQANQAKKQNNTGAIVSFAVGGAMLAAAAYFAIPTTAGGGGQPAMAVMLAGMGGMAMLQGANNSKSASEAGGTSALTASGRGFAGNADVGKYPLEDRIVKSIVDVEKAKEGMALAKKMGIDGKSPVKINGKEYKPSDFSSRESMLAAGLSPAMVNTALAIAAKAEKAAIAKLGALTAAQGFEESSGSSASAAAVAKPVDYNPTPSSYYGGGQLRDVASVNTAGLTKNFNGEPIGVAADSIFAMMTRRYKLKEKQNSFIDELGVNLQK